MIVILKLYLIRFYELVVHYKRKKGKGYEILGKIV